MFEIEETMKKADTRSLLSGKFEHLQSKAFEAYNRLETPSRVDHLWKYTDPLQFEMDLSNGNGKEGIPFSIEYMDIKTSDNDVEVEVGSDSIVRIGLSEEARKKGVEIKSIADAFDALPHAMESDFLSLIPVNFGKYEALNLYKLQAGLVVCVPDNVHLDKPIHLRRSSETNWLFTRLLLVTGDNVQTTVIDEYKVGNNLEAGINSVIEVVSGDGNLINFVTIQELQKENKLYLTQRNSLGKDSHLEHVTVSLGTGVTKYNWQTYLDGQGAESRWFGMLMGSGKRHFDHHTSQHHRASNTASNMDFKVAVEKNAVSAYTGRIIIDEGAVNCEAFQENRNLVLDDTAKAESIPELEISNDDVRCSHGVTVGPLEQDQVFYLMSRGIEQDEAIKIILNGFFEAIYKRIKVNSVRENTENRLRAVVEG